MTDIIRLRFWKLRVLFQLGSVLVGVSDWLKIMYVQKSLATRSFVMLKPIYLQCLNKYINNSAGNTESIDRRKCGQSFLVWKGEALIQPPIKGQECF